MKSYFFVSSAAKDERRWIQRFHADLEYELRLLAGTAVGGLLDTRPAPGGEAARALADGAGRTRVMVALCSDPYFKDAWCGREWAVFGARVENFGKAGATRLEDGFVRVLWRSTHDPLPPAAGALLAEAGLPDSYRQHGLLWLMRNAPRGPGGYYALVRRFAARIIEAQQIELDALPESAVGAMRPAFGSHGSGASRRTAAVASSGAGPATASGRPPGQRRIAVSYVGADQQWADWLEQLLRQRSYQVLQVRWAHSAGEPLRAAVERTASWKPQVTVVLLSRHYRAPRAEKPGESGTEAWEWLGLDGPLRRRVVRACIDPEPLPEPLRDLPALDLSRLADSAIDALLAAVRAGGPG
ncbi:toll/interleukin-1 receptor domain-containing protein [Frankia sp. AgB32]|uniref:toll/interleukin-1 receptor domain-containing protein n=1 Tax=Frankia sp. AgB32 TaxID=631119 RepID=UPI00200C0172|nr:toll/interleukin-1 receptor domain-containing protein [Frankia sp. AgB32]MCK9894123.1 toll/interleukin-1 receptor domain-containing protein [Frankia sp. AgB32]